MSEEMFNPGRLAKMDQSLAATDEMINNIISAYRGTLSDLGGNRTHALSVSVTAFVEAMRFSGLSEGQMGNIPLILSRMVQMIVDMEDSRESV